MAEKHPKHYKGEKLEGKPEMRPMPANNLLTPNFKVRSVRDWAMDIRDIYIFMDQEIDTITGQKKRYMAKPINLNFRMVEPGEHVAPTLRITEDYAADFLRAFQDIHVEPHELEKKLAEKDALIKALERVIEAKDDQIANLREAAENNFRMLEMARRLAGPYEMDVAGPSKMVINNQGSDT